MCRLFGHNRTKDYPDETAASEVKGPQFGVSLLVVCHNVDSISLILISQTYITSDAYEGKCSATFHGLS